MRFLLATLVVLVTACTISYNGTEDVPSDALPNEPAASDVADAAIPMG